MFSAFARDLRFAWRQFSARPGFALTAVLVLALGLGANIAIFSVVYLFLLRPLPYPQADRLVTLNERATDSGGDEGMNPSPGNFLDWQQHSTNMEQISAFGGGPGILSSGTGAFEPERVQICYCSGNFLAALRVAPLLGRAFRPEDDRFGASRVALVSYRLWQQRLGGTPDIVGEPIVLDGDTYRVAGVMQRTFFFPNDTIDVWTPMLLGMPPAAQIRRDLHYLEVFGRIREGVSMERARAELDGILSRYKREHSDVAMGNGAIVTPLREAMVEDVHGSLLILLGAVGCVLLIACVNVGNLLLTRSSARVRELAIRVAVGASRREIMRQMLTESTLLALAGGAAGIALAAFLTPILLAHAPGVDAVVPPDSSAIEPAVFLFAFVLALVTGIAVGFYPALQGGRSGPAAGLRESTRSATSGRSHARFRGMLIAAEVALSLVLLIAAGLLVRSFQRLLGVKTGFRGDNTLTMTFSFPNSYKTAESRSAFFQQVSRRLQTVPGVASVGLGSCQPVSGNCNALFFYRDDRPFTAGKFLVAREWSIDPGYLAAAGIPFLRGRNFTPRDGLGFDPKNPHPGTILINQAMAHEFFPGEDPIGKRIFFDYAVQRAKLQGGPVVKYEIVGVVGDTVASLDRAPEPTLYRPLLDGDYGRATILLHTRVAPQAVADAALREIHGLDRSLAVFDVRTFEEALGRSAADRRFAMLLFGSFAALALLLASVGLYGVLSYTVTQRRGEIGIRMALGASQGHVSRFILWEGLKPALAGIAIGFGAALFVCRILRSLLFGIVPLDPLTFSVVPPLLVGVSVLACYLPALRATRVDPTVALRSE